MSRLMASKGTVPKTGKRKQSDRMRDKKKEMGVYEQLKANPYDDECFFSTYNDGVEYEDEDPDLDVD